MERVKHIRYFLFGQHLADGIRVTITIVAPALLYAFLGDIETGILTSLGAFCLSISDAPGPVKHKRNGMFYGLIFVTLMAFLTGILNQTIVGMGVLIAVSTFFFSMFNIYGSRAASVGTAALLIMILRMAHLPPLGEVLRVTLDVAAGGIWYMVSAMSFYILIPNRPAQRALGECISETARYLLIKSELYDIKADFKVSYKRLIDQQAIVNEKQDAVRELLFKSRSFMKESTYEGRLLLVTFVSIVDLFEQIMATWYDYKELRKKYGESGVLDGVSHLIKKLSEDLSDIGIAIHSQEVFKRRESIIPLLTELKIKTEQHLSGPLDVTLRKMIINLRNLDEHIDRIGNYFSMSKKDLRTNISNNDYKQFVSHQKIDGSLFFNNLNMHSSAFRHSLRVMITCIAGYALALLIFKGNHSYWILMTIIIIMKPAYSLTKEKNIDRLSGTAGGAIIALLLLFFIKNDTVIFILMVFCMLGTYTFIRLNYVVMVLFLTPYVLMLFHFLNMNIVNIAGERLMDTAIAGALAWIAIHYLFPRWESFTIKTNIINVLKANLKYLNCLRGNDRERGEINGSRKKTNIQLQYRLARKDVFVSTANLSAALHRMQSEPKSRQQNKSEIYELVVLNHVLSSNIASLLDAYKLNHSLFTGSQLTKIQNSMDELKVSVQYLDPDILLENNAPLKSTSMGEGNNAVNQQLDFVKRITVDIRKIVLKIPVDQK